jgi:hypothetical protein
MEATKKTRGQFYTNNCDYILESLPLFPPGSSVVEPFAGKGDLINWLSAHNPDCKVEAYDIDPKHPNIKPRDTLLSPPDYSGKYVITNPPYLARNKSPDKTLFDKYQTNDLYKCAVKSLVDGKCLGCILIIPAGFFFSPREIDRQCRDLFLRNYNVKRINYFEERVFDDTPTTVVALSAVRSDEPLTEQLVEWVRFPSRETKLFQMKADCNWIIVGAIYDLDGEVSVGRCLTGVPLKPNEYKTDLTLTALDSGKVGGEISLKYLPDYCYLAKESSRTFATLKTNVELTPQQQMSVADDFNKFLREQRQQYWSLFLPQFRESKEYARKRIPFDLAYKLVAYFISLDLDGETSGSGSESDE